MYTYKYIYIYIHIIHISYTIVLLTCSSAEGGGGLLGCLRALLRLRRVPLRWQPDIKGIVMLLRLLLKYYCCYQQYYIDICIYIYHYIVHYRVIVCYVQVTIGRAPQEKEIFIECLMSDSSCIISVTSSNINMMIISITTLSVD